MKTLKTITLISLILISISSFGQSAILNKIFDKYEYNENFSEVHITQKMLKSIVPMNDGNVEGKEIVENFKEIRLISNEANEMIVPSFIEIIKELKTQKYEKLMSMKESGEMVSIYLLENKNGKIIDFVMLSSDTRVSGSSETKTEQMILRIRGTLTLKQVVMVGELVDVNIGGFLDL